MTLPPPLPAPGYDQDAEHLRILSICWYVLAGLQGIVACFVLLYVAFGAVMAMIGAAAGTAVGAAARDPSGAIFGVPFVGMGLFVGCFGTFLFLVAGTVAFLNFKTGQSLARRRNLTLIYVMAAIACIGVPVGTVLGVFTFVVLSRPSVRASFG
ncbi:MAG: hypothetical protein ACTHN5_01900 [Phycisphaerae bacterium]